MSQRQHDHWLRVYSIVHFNFLNTWEVQQDLTSKVIWGELVVVHNREQNHSALYWQVLFWNVWAGNNTCINLQNCVVSECDPKIPLRFFINYRRFCKCFVQHSDSSLFLWCLLGLILEFWLWASRWWCLMACDILVQKNLIFFSVIFKHLPKIVHLQA